MSTYVKDNSIVLFQGDSVTDAGRDYETASSLGMGYPMMIAAAFTAMYPEKNVTFVNKGISGNRVKDLEERWGRDCVELMPTTVSILIGINDTWRRYDSNDPTSIQDFENTYRRIITKVKEKTNAEIILIEPFLLPVNVGQENWREDLDPKIQVVRKLAKEFKALLIPMDGIFAAASSKVNFEVWSGDGVHPTSAGHALIAKSWMDVILK
jgi:acyl-CoA thioesterase I